jgi:hypothetical protein
MDGSVYPTDAHESVTYSPVEGRYSIVMGVGGPPFNWGYAGTMACPCAAAAIADGTEPGKSFGQKGGQDMEVPCAMASVGVLTVSCT